MVLIYLVLIFRGESATMLLPCSLSMPLWFFFFQMIMVILKEYLNCVHLILEGLHVSPVPTLCHCNEVQFTSAHNYTASMQSTRFLKGVYHI